jgi:protocatechuate 3,4-dioxygenase beta subunit
MRPLLVLVLVLGAIGALLFAVFSLGSTPKEQGGVGPAAAQTPVVAPSDPVQLGGERGGEEAASAVRGTDRTVAGGESAVALDNRLTGVVIDHVAAPVANAEVILTTLNAEVLVFANDPKPDLSREPRARTDAEGRYAFTGVQPRNRYTLIVTHPDYARREEPSVPIGESGSAEMPPIVLGPGATLAGRVRNELGDAIAGATLHLEGASYMGLGEVAPDRMTVTSDAGGAYEFKNVARGGRFLTVSAPGFAQISIPNVHFEKEEVVVRDVILKTAEAICGRVFGPGNVGVPGAKVIAIGISATQQTTRVEVLTDQNGEFCFENLAPGEYNMIASARGWRMISRNNRVAANTANHMIEMAKEPTISGRVVEKGSGAPVTAFSVRLRAFYGQGTPTAPIDEQVFAIQDPGGNFTVDAVPANELVVEAFAPGRAPGFSAPFAVRPGTPVTGVVVQLGAGGTISGRVVDTEGKPIARAKVATHDNEWADDAFTRALGATYPTNATQTETRTDKDGRFTLKNLNPERYQISVEANGYTAFTQRDIVVNDAVDTPIGDVRLGRGGVVRGTVFDAAGKPLSGGTVTLRITAGDVAREYSTRSGADGRYEIGSVAPGRYAISAMRPGGGDGNPFEQIVDVRDTEINLTVEEGQVTTQDLHLTE